jgi:hypothetical protein
VCRHAEFKAADIEETDLLVVDTWQLNGRLGEGLRRHGASARRFIVLPNATATAGERPTASGVEEFLTAGRFRLKEYCPSRTGLAILERCVG